MEAMVKDIKIWHRIKAFLIKFKIKTEGSALQSIFS